MQLSRAPAVRVLSDNGLTHNDSVSHSVVLYNDDNTTMQFVQDALMKFFINKTKAEAMRIMLEVHHSGNGVVGRFARGVAEAKAEQVRAYAKKHGQPLNVRAVASDREDERAFAWEE
jgi:ATP-dependent Clp protease adaptor protein ClpS